MQFSFKIDNPDGDRNYKYFQWYWFWLLLSLGYTNQRYLNPKEKYLLTFVKFPFQIKAWKLNYVPHNFYDLSVKACLPADIKLEDSTVVYSLTNSIRSKIFNFNKSVSNLDVRGFLQGNTILPCNCSGSRFIDKDHLNIVTGDLRIVGNNKLSTLFTKGPKYRETNHIL